MQRAPKSNHALGSVEKMHLQECCVSDVEHVCTCENATHVCVVSEM